MEKKKVLFVATVVKTHINVFHIPYLKMLKDMGYETYVASKNDYENPNDCIIPYCDNFYDICFERNPLKKNNIKAYKRLKDLMLTENFDIVHCHTPVGGLLTRLVYKRIKTKIKTKCFYTAHGFHFYKGAPLINWLMYYPVEKYLSKYTDTLITINKEDYQNAKNEFNMKQLIYIPGVGINLSYINSVQSDRERYINEIGIKKGAFLLLSVGELIDRKNHQFVIKIMKHLPNYMHYIIVGEGEQHESLIQLVKKLKLEDRVHFFGFRTDVIKIMKSTDIFIFPSLQEGLPVALMEAMACGLPCIASNIRGNIDLINNGENGLLFNINEKESLINYINLLNENVEFKMNIINNSYESSKKYDIEKIMEKMKKLYI